MSRYAPAIKRLLAVLVVLAVAVFFWRAFSRNWQSIRAHSFEIHWAYLLFSFACIAANCLLATLAWHESVNALSPSKLTFKESIAFMNASGLVKYVPGKVWTYALQMYWLGKRDISKSLVVYINIINVAVSLLMSTLLGLVLLLLGPERLPHAVTLGLLVALAVVDFACIRFNAPLFSWGMAVLNKLFKRNIETFDVPLGMLLRLHAFHFGAAVSFASAGYAVCLGIGYQLTPMHALVVMSSFLLSDVVAFLAVVSPGGLGVREGIMYALLGGAASGSLALVVPLAARAVSMLVDVALGGLALRLLSGLRKPNGSASLGPA